MSDPTTLAVLLAALGTFITTVVAAVVTLRKEFHKAAEKLEEVHTIVNSQMADLTEQRDTLLEENISLKGPSQ